MEYVFVIFGILTCLGFLFVVFLVPETKDYTPETMHELFTLPWCCSSSVEYQSISENEESEEDVRA